MNFLILIGIIFSIHWTAAKDWWENGNFYQIYPRSFKDSDGDGVGDLKGVEEKLQYIKDLGMTGAWLSPIFKSPMADFGYDISDYYQIQPEYGSNEDLFNLLKKANDISLRIILDFVPNHTSDEHEWFQKSIESIEPYTDYYIWEEGSLTPEGKRVPPNNWVNSFRGSAWTWNEKRQKFYYHAFGVKQPDLNYRNPKVAEDMKKVLRFWLEKGVHGFRIDAVPYLFELKDLTNEPIDDSCTDPEDYCHTFHIYTKDQPESYEMVYDWHDLVDNFKKEYNTETKLLMTEAYTDLKNTLKFYGNGIRNGSNIPFNFELITKTNKNSSGKDFSNVIDSWLNNMPKGVLANWVMGNHDNKRLASIYGEKRADLFNIMLQTLPGNAITYNGEELGMTDVYISWKDTVDPQACNANPSNFNSYSRDPARTPFPWDDSFKAGFSTAQKTWLPVGTNYLQNNVKYQLNSPNSHLKIFKQLVNIRKEAAFQDGSFEKLMFGDDIMIYRRSKSDSASFIVVLNFGKTTEILNLRKMFSNVGRKIQVITSSLQSNYKKNNIVEAAEFYAYGEVGAVLALC